MKRYAGAFVTIEYTLLIPILLILYTFLVYIGLFLHNQCVLQANVYILGVEGSSLTATDAAEEIRQLQAKEQLLYHKYLLAEDMAVTYKVQGNQVLVSSSGRMANPFYTIGLGEAYWELKAECEATSFSNINTLRLCKQAFKLFEKISIGEVETDGSGTEIYSGKSEELY